ncbi:MAG: FecR family protein [Prevotella sp.]
MKDFNDIRRAAISYFEGKATPSEESTVLEYLEGNNENMKQFRLWEKQWIENHVPDAETEKAWERFKSAIDSRQKTYRLNPSVSGNSHSGWWKYAVAAAVTCLVTIAAWNVLNTTKDVTFACSTPAGSTTQVTLPDGTTVWLKASSQIKYSDNRKDGTRDVELQGEANFDVTSHKGSKFVVHTNQYDVTVKGTKFNVTAYSDDETVTTTLVEGSIDINRDDSTMKMVPGDMVTYNKKTGKMSKQASDRNTDNWLEDNMELHDVTLVQFAKIISRRYNVKIFIKDKKIGDMKISAILRNNESIEDVVSALRRITNRKISQKGRTISID